ncbi:hypothetical protein [Sporosarcina sp. P34]|uniref:hypothetical protein n=1 Tax=Sporosarcina sp. P34 TaxID=2048247 RepID=UPI00117D279D|nr:hypothetical protein [Sporosarcina sp. P34]
MFNPDKLIKVYLFVLLLLTIYRILGEIAPQIYFTIVIISLVFLKSSWSNKQLLMLLIVGIIIFVITRGYELKGIYEPMLFDGKSLEEIDKVIAKHQNLYTKVNDILTLLVFGLSIYIIRIKDTIKE